MKYIAEIQIMPHKELLDPQGKAVLKNLKNINVEGVADMRIGKHVKMTLEASSEAEAKEKIEATCKNLLANVIMEKYSYELTPQS